MGLLPCPLSSCHSDSESQSNHQLLSEPSTSSSLSSLPSLPSVPSLNPQSHQQHDLEQLLLLPTTHHRCLATLKSHSAYISSLVLAGNFLNSASSDGEIRAWTRSDDPASTQNNTLLANNISMVKSLVVVEDHNLLFSAHQDHKIRVWKLIQENPIKFKPIATLPTLKDRLPRLFSAKNYVEVRRHKKCTWVHHVDAVSALALSKDRSLLYSASWDRSFKIWRTSDFKCLDSVTNAHDDAINAIALSDDGLVYTGSADRKIKVWRKVVGEKKQTLVGTLEKHKSAVNALAFSTDGTVLYSGACDRSVLVWERDGSGGGGGMVVVGALRGHRRAILCLAVVADLVCSGSADSSVRVWRRGVDRSYCCLCVLEGHTRPVKSLTAALDYRSSDSHHSGDYSSFLVYSGSLDCDIKVWQIQVPLMPTY